MDQFARLPSGERRVYFEQAAARLGLSAQIIEKDFWVCWTLRRLFSLAEFQDHLTFKGGTTLSKVYRIIERFSEDLDIAVERSWLGFGDDKEPERGASGKERQRRVDRLQAACAAAIAEHMRPQLQTAIYAQIGAAEPWSLADDHDDKSAQTLLFEFPPAVATDLNPYFAPSVKIEMGARSDHFPVEPGAVTPHLFDAFPDALPDSIARVRVLAAERTFWEKATILHSLHHAQTMKEITPRMSRHYYDVYRMAESPVWQRALAAIELLDRVADHKSVFFKSAWAHYDTARPGTLRLTPSAHIIRELSQDYIAMQPMFFGEPPSFQEILASLPALEARINGTV